MVDHPLIQIKLEEDFLPIRDIYVGQIPVVYTGSIDSYFDSEFGDLNWRTLDFENEILDTPDFQGTSVVNYADSDVRFTRIHEFKHLHPERNYDIQKTFISREYSRMAQRTDEPYYPVGLSDDLEKLREYKRLAKAEKNVWFGGRLGSYKYLDMHMAIGAALTMFENELIPFYSRG